MRTHGLVLLFTTKQMTFAFRSEQSTDNQRLKSYLVKYHLKVDVGRYSTLVVCGLQQNKRQVLLSFILQTESLLN